MKKTMIRVLAVLLLLASVCTLAACKKNTTVPDGMQDVTAGTMNEFFRFYAPEGWISQASGGISGARVSNQPGAANVIVTMTMPTSEGSVPEYWETKCVPAYQGEFGASFALDPELCKDTTLGGINAKQYVFNCTMDGKDYKVMQILVFKSGYLYTMTYTALAEKFSDYLETVENVRAAITFV